ncbi:hypothetical protein SUGI_0962540 [Cryptomeria japonica]|uniref:uncharacterized protein LOC131039745 n=1 Tax=Cryptomeria japonica TaxID=3369 RepID=UPI0024146AD7|nr:uncharacterized protein LOC131039745 [Cryptomeria japonica]GLJ45736.1 hypothetical protein SUGI_0962540 [Cryptomeria japonica]
MQTGTGAKMGLRIIQCALPRQTVRVIQPDGQIRQFLLPITVSELLILHPHHYVSQAKAKAATGKRKSAILPLDTHLESGGIYILLPLPRLFPCSSSSSSSSFPFSSSSSCTCFQELAFLHSGFVLKRPWSIVSPSGQGPLKISEGGTVVGVKPRRLWEPALDVIMENRLLLQTKEEELSALKKKNRDKAKNGLQKGGDKKGWIFHAKGIKS